jgi:RNA polymerase sigma-70 factor, ECF subfamily
VARDGTVSASGPDARQAAFERYVVPELAVLYRVALSLTGQPADAEDLVQDTLVRAFRALDRFDGAYPRAWLLTILRNAHANRNRRRRPVLLRDGDDAPGALDRLAPRVPASEDVVMTDQFEAGVAQALDALPDKHRAVIALVDIDGLSYQQAADALGIPRGTVMSRLHRARARIRAALDAGSADGRWP